MVKKHKKIAALLATLALGGLAVVPMTAQAGTETASTGKEAKPTAPVETPSATNISGDAGIAFVSTYYSRGILQGPEGKVGFDAQPYLDLYFKLYEDDKAPGLNKVTLNLGFWANIASKPGTSALSSNSNWTEFDWMPGISFVFAKNFTLTVSYFELDYPGESSFAAISGATGRNFGNFSPQRSINTTLAYNDSDLLGMWALNPHITFLQELTGNNNSGGGHTGLGLGGGNKLGQYYEIGIAPSFTFMKSSKYPLTLTLPLTAGFGSSGFYGTGFGYASAGGNFSVPLAFIPSCFGNWTATAGGTYYYLGTNTARANGQFSNSGADHDAGVASLGLGLTF